MFTVTLFPAGQKIEATQVSIGGWMYKHNMVYVYNEILALKREEILTHSATWMNLEYAMVSEESSACQVLWGQKWSFSVSDYKVMKRGLWIDSGDSCKTLWMYLMPLNCTPNG